MEELQEVMDRVATDSFAFPNLYASSGGSPGRAMRLLQGLEDCGGIERLQALMKGEGASRPETLVDYLPARPKETKKARVQRLLQLLVDATWGSRHDSDGSRIALADRSRRFVELLADLDRQHNPELILEEAGLILSS